MIGKLLFGVLRTVTTWILDISLESSNFLYSKVHQLPMGLFSFSNEEEDGNFQINC